MYHYYELTDTGAAEKGRNLEFHIEKFTGDMQMVMQAFYPPLKLVPPYLTIGSHDESIYFERCDAEDGKLWIGLLGGAHCAVYDIEVYKHHNITENCASLEYKEQTAQEAATLRPAHFEYGSCEGPD